MARHQRRLGAAIVIAGLCFIAGLTLVPASEASTVPLTCIFCSQRGSVDVVLNILLFLPLGFGLALSGLSWRRALVLAAMVSFLVESLQWGIIPGRDATLGDLIMNTIGGALGAWIGHSWRLLIFPQPRVARWLALTWALGLIWVWAGTAWAFGPLWPHDVPWSGQWAPSLEYYGQFTGRPLLIEAGGQPLLPGLPLDESRLEDDIAARPELMVRAVLSDTTDRPAPLGAVVDRWGRIVILLGQDGNDLYFSYRMRAVRAKLRNPAFSLHGGLTGRPGDTVNVDGALADGTVMLTSKNGSQVRSRSLPLSASWGWSLILPWDHALGNATALLTGLWILGLISILAYWCTMAGGAVFVVPFATVGVLLDVIPQAAGFSIGRWNEWAAAGLALAAGGATASVALKSMRSGKRGSSTTG